jgi:subtilisin family serine protease
LTQSQISPRTTDQWHLAGADCAWKHSKGKRVVIAIMDTGCDFSHPDLGPNAWTNRGEIPGNGIDDDGNGYVDDIAGYNFGDGNTDLTDISGHGTHVAATAAAAGVNMVSGTAPEAKIMCLKIADTDGKMYASYVFAAYEYAAKMGAHIIVNSFSNTFWKVPEGPARASQRTKMCIFSADACCAGLAGCHICVFDNDT